VLAAIVSERRADADAARRDVAESELRREAAARPRRSLGARLRGAERSVIAEVKKASPSAGLLRADYCPAGLARRYEAAGAAAISVLTEPRHFLGSESHLREVRAAVELPVLRKDFLCDPYQVWEAAAWGADAVLLIVAALDPGELGAMYRAALEAGLDVLAEAHTEADLDRALGLEQAIVGVNSRDLKTLRTDLAVALRLAARIPRGRLAVAESGIRSRDDVQALAGAGYRGFLIGETLLRDEDPGAALARLLAGGRDGGPPGARQGASHFRRYGRRIF